MKRKIRPYLLITLLNIFCLCGIFATMSFSTKPKNAIVFDVNVCWAIRAQPFFQIRVGWVPIMLQPVPLSNVNYANKSCFFIKSSVMEALFINPLKEGEIHFP